MRGIKLKKIILSDFKGVKSLEIDFKDTTTISGANATGKTTIFDAFTWLLFDKDSLNRSNFGIKTYDEDGQVYHGLDHSVEAYLLVQESLMKLKKIYLEIWTKKRGSSEKVFSGHTTDYFINDVPVKKNEYDARIESIIPEDKFKLLTNPHYFNEILDKKQRREIILSLEEIDDKDVISTMKPVPKELIEQLVSYTIEEVQAIARGGMKKANKAIQELPVRIDELTGQIKEYDFKNLEKEKKEVQTRLDLINGSIKNSQVLLNEINEKTRSITSKKLRMKEMEREVEEDALRQREEARRKQRDHEYKIKELQEKILEAHEDQHLYERETEESEVKLRELRRKWEEESSELPPSSHTCNTCGQTLPEEQAEEIIKRFNSMKSQRLEELAKTAGEVKKRLFDSQQGKMAAEDFVKKHEEEFMLLQSKNNSELPEIEIKDIDPEYHKLKKEVEKEEAELINTATPQTDESVQIKREALQEELSQVEEKLAAKARNSEILERIKELGKKEKDLARIYEEQEKLLTQTEKFTVAKTELISDKVNAHFTGVSFKLFDVQVNGGITDTCEALVDGVPYSDANNAAKINAGLDVINTLSMIYKMSAPVFIDNAESVNELIQTNSQVIRLVVSTDKKLKIS